MKLNRIKFTDDTLEKTMAQINEYLKIFPYKVVIQVDDKGHAMNKYGDYQIIIWYYNNNV